MNIIFDLDGTLADCSHRLHHIQSTPKDWASFFRCCTEDKPIHDVIDLLHLLEEAYTPRNYIYIVSGRSDECRDKTKAWLNDYAIPYQALYMRRMGDKRPDWVVKKEIYYQEFKDKEIKVDYVFDDRDSVVAMWRSLGLRCLQVAPGNF